MEDVNVFATVAHKASTIVNLTADLVSAGCAVSIADTASDGGYNTFRYRNGGWQWDAGLDQWLPASRWGGGFSATFTAPEQLDENFAYVELFVQEAWTGEDVEFNWPNITADIDDVTQRIMRGLLAADIGGSELPCMDVSELLGQQVSPPTWTMVDRVISEMQEVDTHKTVLDGSILTISFTLTTGEAGSVSVELNHDL